MGDDPQSLQANQAYKEAMDKLLQTYEARSEKPFFDPKMLSLAQAFAKPTQTGSIFESLGNVAGSLNKSQEEEQTKAEELAKMRLEMAGMGVGQANQRAAMQMYREGTQPSAAPPGGPSGAPPGAPPAQPAPQSPSDFALQSMGIEGQGVQVFPPQPLMPEKQFLAAQAFKGVNPMDAKIAYQDYLRKDIEVAQNGNVIQRSTGRMFDLPDPNPVEVPFLTLGGEKFTVSKTQARTLDQATMSGDQQKRIALENKYRGVAAQAPSPAQMVAQAPAAPLGQEVSTAPVAPPKVITALPTTGAPTAVVPPSPPPAPPPAASPPPSPASQGMKSPAQLAREKAEEEQRRAIALKQAESDIATKAETAKANKKDEQETIVEIKRAGRNQVNIADQYAKLITKYPNAIGTAAKPGFLSAGITILESGASIGGESAKASALQEAVSKLTGTPEELSARRVMMGLAAEYLFNLRALAKGQGAITDYETQILARIGPGIEDDPKTARFKAAIMKMHGEAEIARANQYNEWKKNNQGLGWKDYLGSKEHDKFSAEYDQDLAKAYDIYLGQRPRQAAPAQPAQAAPNPSMEFARGFRRP
jgi:hypothetical protein